MVGLVRSWLASSLLLSLLAQQGLSTFVFRDIEPPQLAPKRLAVRGTENHNASYYSGLDPQRQDSFYWGGMYTALVLFPSCTGSNMSDRQQRWP